MTTPASRFDEVEWIARTETVGVRAPHAGTPPPPVRSGVAHWAVPAAVPPRLYAQVAARAPVAAVFRRGPASWWQVGRWDLVSGDYEPGAWLRGGLYPRRGDLSPDGTLLLSFLMKRTRGDFLGPAPGPGTYFTVSKLPWLTALAAWREGSTWTRGCHFVEGPPSRRPFVLGEPGDGDAAPLRRRYGVADTPAVQYAAERRRGWVEAPDSPPREEGGPWDERRRSILVKDRPGGGPGRLVLLDRGVVRGAAVELRAPAFAVERRSRRVPLDGVQWADWDPAGRLLVATVEGRLEIRDPDDRRHRAAVRSHDLAALWPDPRQAPAWALRW